MDRTPSQKKETGWDPEVTPGGFTSLDDENTTTPRVLGRLDSLIEDKRGYYWYDLIKYQTVNSKPIPLYLLGKTFHQNNFVKIPVAHSS